MVLPEKAQATYQGIWGKQSRMLAGAVSEKRKDKRYPKRFKVRYGEKELSHAGFTENVSGSGIFIVASALPRLGTQLHLELFYSAERSAYLEAEVRRVVVVEPHLRQMVKAGFGVRFLTPGELVEKVMGRTASRQPFVLRYATASDFSAAFHKELSQGGAFVQSSQKPVLHSPAEVHVHLPFSKTILEFNSTVVHVADGGPNKFGVGLVFLDKQFAVESLKAHLPR
jgi:hypothetical protein